MAATTQPSLRATPNPLPTSKAHLNWVITSHAARGVAILPKLDAGLHKTWSSPRPPALH